ncbi:hypothetical protein [Bartonella sp. AC140YNZD]|uniref:hypothetical protein n=1 Tax=Bartonella sp. AC140YNZD TaxID=3243447 RepID=UPI0035D093D1
MSQRPRYTGQFQSSSLYPPVARGMQREVVVCHYYNTAGHMVRNCPYKVGGPSQMQGCYKCGSFDHNYMRYPMRTSGSGIGSTGS